MVPYPSSTEPVEWLTWLLEAGNALSTLADGDDYTLYELMHQRAALLAPVDACYTCLFRPDDDTLFFSYNFDQELYDEPLIIPMGNGPTSWVVRNGLPFVLSADTEERHNANINFGHGEHISLSAIHLPLLVRTSSREPEVLGVFSIQSYRANVYSDAVVLALQLLCSQLALRLYHRRLQRRHDFETQEVKAQLQIAQAHQIRIADHFVELLQPITRQAHELTERLKQNTPLERAQLKASVEELRRSCYRVQTEGSQLPLTPRTISETGHTLTTPSERNPLRELSTSQLEVLRLIATGADNRKIAKEIGRSVDTVKKHCGAIYRKLDAGNRTEAARIYAIYAASTKNTQMGNPRSPNG